MKYHTEESSFRVIEKNLSAGVKRYHQAAAIAYEIYRHEQLYANNHHFRIEFLKNKFLGSLQTWECDDLLEHQMRYAIRIARSGGNLEYEEMHKLFSLADEIAALTDMGLKAGSILDEEFAEALRFRFDLEKRKAHLVAQDRFEDWKKNWWWYTENRSC